MAMPVAEYEIPTLDWLASKAEAWLKKNEPKTYREKKKSGELAEYTMDIAKRTKEYAEDLINSGTWAGQAYIQAERSVICGSETD